LIPRCRKNPRIGNLFLLFELLHANLNNGSIIQIFEWSRLCRARSTKVWTRQSQIQATCSLASGHIIFSRGWVGLFRFVVSK
jgi:hypothetical protein